MVSEGKLRKLEEHEMLISQFEEQKEKFYGLNQERINKTILQIEKYIDKGKAAKQFNKIGKAINHYDFAVQKINNLDLLYELSIRGEAEEYTTKINILTLICGFSCVLIIGGVITLFVLRDLVYAVEILPINPLTLSLLLITVGSAITLGIVTTIMVIKHEKMKKRIQSEM